MFSMPSSVSQLCGFLSLPVKNRCCQSTPADLMFLIMKLDSLPCLQMPPFSSMVSTAPLGFTMQPSLLPYTPPAWAQSIISWDASKPKVKAFKHKGSFPAKSKSSLAPQGTPRIILRAHDLTRLGLEETSFRRLVAFIAPRSYENKLFARGPAKKKNVGH